VRVRLCSFLQEFDWLKAILCCLGYPPREGDVAIMYVKIVGWAWVAMLQPYNLTGKLRVLGMGWVSQLITQPYPKFWVNPGT